MWKEQLQAMRVRARSEQRRAAELEGEVRRLGGSLADVTPANDFGSPEPAPQRRDGAGSGDLGSGGTRGAPSGEKLRDAAGKVFSKVDGRLDGVFDKVEGLGSNLAMRLTRGTGALRERLVREEDR